MVVGNYNRLVNLFWCFNKLSEAAWHCSGIWHFGKAFQEEKVMSSIPRRGFLIMMKDTSNYEFPGLDSKEKHLSVA
jgi:hypothetical protein